MRIPRKVLLLGMTMAMLALIPASSAFGYSAGEKKAEKKQNARIKKLSKDLSAAKNKIREFDKTFSTQGASLTSIDTRLKTIEGAAPALIDGLGKLKTGLETAGAGLTSLKTLATSQEYGVAQVFIGATPLAGAFLTTPDIPDAVHQAQTMGTFLATGAGAITVRVAVRSAESDGTGSSLPAAHCRVTATGSGGSTTTSKPNTGLGGAPFWAINTKSALTSTDPANAGFPFGPKTSGADADNLVDLTDTSGSGNAVAPGGPGTEAASSGPGQAITVQLSCVDTSPSTTDPSA
jgi:hypothetical protein